MRVFSIWLSIIELLFIMLVFFAGVRYLVIAHSGKLVSRNIFLIPILLLYAANVTVPFRSTSWTYFVLFQSVLIGVANLPFRSVLIEGRAIKWAIGLAQKEPIPSLRPIATSSLIFSIVISVVAALCFLLLCALFVHLVPEVISIR